MTDKSKTVSPNPNLPDSLCPQDSLLDRSVDVPLGAGKLRTFPLLAALSDAELEYISSKLTFESDHLGQIGARTTVEEVRFTLILSGSYRICALSADGARVILRTVGPGGHFGEMGILANKAPGNWLAIAEKPGDVLYMSRADFLEVLERVPDLRMALLYTVTTQAARWAERIFELSILSPRARLLSALLRLAETRGLTGPQAMLELAPTHYDLASEVGLTREAVSRLMKALRQEGLVVSSRRQILLTDLPRLRAIVNSEID